MSRIWGAGAAAVVAGMLFGVALDADAGGRRIFWSETGVQLNDRPLPPGKRIWSRESGDQPDTGYWALVTPFTEDALVEGLNTPGGVFVDVLNGHLYWVDSATRQVSRSDLDGGGAQTLFIADGNPEAVAFDPGSGSVFITIFPETGIDIDVRNGKLYYAVAGAGQIRRKNFDGSDDELLITTNLPSPRGVELDLVNGFIYWAEDDDPGSIPDNPDNSAIYRANLDGTGMDLLVDTGQVAAWGVAVDPFLGDLYWAAPNGLPASCNAPPPNQTDPPRCFGSLWHAAADGASPTLLFFGVPEPKGIALEMPISGCNRGSKSKLSLKPEVSWKWGGGDAVTKEEFGDPTTDTDYYLCFFDEERPSPVVKSDLDSACTLAEPGSFWKEKKKGFKRSTGSQRGIVKVNLKAGEAGKAKVKAKAKIISQPTKPFDQDPYVVTQLVTGDLQCWESVFERPSKLNDGAKFKDKVPD